MLALGWSRRFRSSLASVRFRVGPLATSTRRFFSARSPDLLLSPTALLGESRGLLLLDRRRVLRPAALGRDSPDCVWGLAPYTLGAGRGRLPGVVTLPNLGREVGPRNPEV